MAGKPLNYFEMWWLILQNYNATVCPDAAFRKTVTHELLISLFWEETQFQNRRQLGFDHNDWLKRWTTPVPEKHNPNGNHAVGFGQTERESFITIKVLRPRLLKGLIPGTDPKSIDSTTIDEVILADDHKAVQFAWRTLWSIYSGKKKKTVEGLIKAFGGPPNEHKVPGILRCARVLTAYQKMPPITVAVNSMYPNLLLMAGAFWNARQNGDFQRAFGVAPSNARMIGGKLQTIADSADLVGDLHKYVTEIAKKHKNG